MLVVSMERLIVLIIYALTVCSTNGKPKHQLPQEPGEAAMVFENFENVVAIFDIDKDGDLDCLTAVRTDYNRGARSTKYVWILKGLHGHQPRNVTYLVLAGPERGEFMFKNLDDDGPFQKGSYDYSDYKNCIVMRIPYNSGEECVLWVSEEAKDKIPQKCMDYYEDSCDDAKLAYDKESCEGVHS